MSAFIPNITSYPTQNPNPPSQYPYGFQDPSGLHLVGAPYEHVGVTMSEPANAVLVTTRQPENIPPFHCEVCNISCNTKDVLERHNQGKKHIKNVKKLADAPNMVPLPVASETSDVALENKKRRLLENGATTEALLYCDICNVICNNQEGFQKHIASKKHSAKSIIQQASTNAVFDANSDSSGGSQKKLVGFPCEICNIICTSDELLQVHKAGKKHLKKVKESGQIPNLPLPVTPIALQDTPPTKPVVNPESNEVNLQGAIPPNLPLTPIASQDAPPTNPMANPESSEDKSVNIIGANPCIASQDTPTKPVVNQESDEGKTVNLHGAIWACELCGISCNTDEVLKIHLSGKKHRKNLEKSEKPIGPNPALTTEPAETPKVIGPLQEEGERVGSKRKGKKGGGDDDVEAKKQRILQSGTALDAVQTCDLCNVVCNSPKVFIAHLAGQKHAAMAVKQAETQAKAAGQES